MLIKADTHAADLGVVQKELHERSQAPPAVGSSSRLFSSPAPYLYLTGAFAAIVATLYVPDWFWILPHYVLLCAGTIHLAIAVRRKYPR